MARAVVKLATQDFDIDALTFYSHPSKCLQFKKLLAKNKVKSI